MGRLILMHTVNNHATDHMFSIPLGIGLFVVVSIALALCANHGRRANSRKEDSKDNTGTGTDTDKNANKTTIMKTTTTKSFDSAENDDFYQENWPPRSPLRSPKQLITTISNKALNSLVINHKRGRGGSGGGGDGGKVVEEGFGQGGLWQKEILMGVKCQPPEFSGVIYYDCDGRQVSEFPPRSPRSPRIARSPDFTFPAIRSQV